MANVDSNIEASTQPNPNNRDASNVDSLDDATDARGRDTDSVDADNDGDDGSDDEAEEEEGEEEEEDVPEPKKANTPSKNSRANEQRFKMENLFQRMASERVPIRVHDVLIRGNTKTKDRIIEAELERIKNVTTMQELLEAAGIANTMLQGLDIFDSVKITLDSGPPELPGTANVIVDVVESSSTITGEIGCYTKTTVCFRPTIAKFL